MAFRPRLSTVDAKRLAENTFRASASDAGSDTE
jgi:hypothetical protein